jgi:hypothetical protein
LTFSISEERLKDRSDGKKRKRHKHLLDKLEEMRRYWNLKQEALHSTT